VRKKIEAPRRGANRTKKCGIFMHSLRTPSIAAIALLGSAALALSVSQASAEHPDYVLKGMTVISYDLAIEKTVGGDQCTVNKDRLETALQFVANQSTKLKIMPDIEYSRRLLAIRTRKGRYLPN
jgi:hypothetical protein